MWTTQAGLGRSLDLRDITLALINCFCSKALDIDWKEGLLRPVELRDLVSVAHAVLSKVSCSQSLNVNYVQSLSPPSQVSPVLGTRDR